MWTPPPLVLPWLASFLILPLPSLAQVGTASFYGPPYLPTACYGSEEGQFPADNLFAAAGQGIWDNGASCGREYLVRCLSSATPDACAQGRTIHVVILDEAAALNSMPSTNGTTMVLSTTAFRMITQHSVDVINIEFTQV
ncbi:EG45-like domain containing protein [Elaeis guineensis]|uniref:EG45-like domain containing protein n=1 Tax=Elaeis guineensis var. tenera TaxID=51953 RepID=UPI00057AA675